MLPVLHLNGYKIANPTVLGRMSDAEVRDLFSGYGHEPIFVEGDDPVTMHQQMAATFDTALDEIAAIQKSAREESVTERPQWPMIVLRSPKGWTGPKIVDGKQVEGTFRAHQVPVESVAKPEHLKILEDWMRSYRAEELFDASGKLIPELAELAPKA